MNTEAKLIDFLAAQMSVYRQVLKELERGQKQSHWIWFIFPQLLGLGHSHMARKYGIADIAEARTYLAHEVLGRRLVECTNRVLGHPDKSIHAIFGSPDDMKFRSSMSLFAIAERGEAKSVFQLALDMFFEGVADSKTMELLGNASG